MFVVCCWLFVASLFWFSFVVSCLVVVACWLAVVVRCLLLFVGCLLFVVCCLLCVVVCCLLVVVFFVFSTFVGSCFVAVFVLSFFLFFFPWLRVSCLLFGVCDSLVVVCCLSSVDCCLLFGVC